MGLTLPTSLEVDGELVKIDSDFRTALLVMQMYNDRALSLQSKHGLMLSMIYSVVDDNGEVVSTLPENVEEAANKAIWFLNIGMEEQDNVESKPRLIDYEKDSQHLFSAVNNVLSREVRSDDYMHWWTFYGFCQSIDDSSLMSNIISIRSKRASGKKLDQGELEFYKSNKDMIDIEGGSMLSKSDTISDMLRNS